MNRPQENSTRKTRIGDILKFVIFFGIGLFFVYWFLLKLDGSQKAAIWQSFISADYVWVGVAMAVCLLSHFVRALRWRLLFEPVGHNPGLNSTFGAVVVAYMANLAFPRLGEVMRCAMLKSSDRIPVEKSLGTVVTERLIDVLAFAAIVVIGCFAMFGKAKDWLYETLSQKFAQLPSIWLVLVIGLAGAVAAIVMYKKFRLKWRKNAFFQKIDDMVTGCVEGVKSVFHLKGKAVTLFIVYSVIIYLLYIAGGLVIFHAFGETSWLGFKTAFVLYLFGSVGMMISQGGLGAYPVLVWQALTIYGISEATGLACGWLLWSSQQAIVIVVGLAYLVYFSFKKKQTKNA